MGYLCSFLSSPDNQEFGGPICSPQVASNQLRFSQAFYKPGNESVGKNHVAAIICAWFLPSVMLADFDKLVRVIKVEYA